MDGIDDNVRIMMIRAVPNRGRTRQRHRAGHPVYVDNSAPRHQYEFVQNLSPENNGSIRPYQYASKGVLLIHAAAMTLTDVD